MGWESAPSCFGLVWQRLGLAERNDFVRAIVRRPFVGLKLCLDLVVQEKEKEKFIRKPKARPCVEERDVM